MKYRLREYVDKYNDTLENLAEYLGIAYQTLSRKMNGHVDFTLSELRKIKRRYNLTDEQMGYIFFDDTDNIRIFEEKIDSISA